MGLTSSSNLHDMKQDGITARRRTFFTREEIHNMIDIIVDNSFFRFGDKVYRQCIGIPMAAPQMANLYLYYYESCFMEKLTKEDYSIAKKFNHTSRYIDDLITLNNDRNLMSSMNRIYPKELVLNLQVKTYDKRDAFNFEIVSYPDLSGNIPAQPAYGVFTSQVIRYARICNFHQDIIDKVQLLIKKLIKKNYTMDGIRRTLTMFKKMLQNVPMDKAETRRFTKAVGWVVI